MIIRTAADPHFTRAGAELRHDLHITVPDAALGSTVGVPPDGRLQVTVPPATQPGTVVRITGRGLPRYGQHGRGDLNVRVIVDAPRQFSPPEQRLYEQLRALEQACTQRAGPAAQTAEPGTFAPCPSWALVVCIDLADPRAAIRCA